MARSITNTLDKLKAEGKLDKLSKAKPKEQGGQATIDLAKIEPDPEQPRKKFSEEKLQSLSESISVQGVLQPITVQPENDEGKHRIIMGERRWRAAQLAGLKTIPAVVREADANLRAIQLTENIQRDDLTTIEIALAVAQMKEDGKTRVQIANDLGWGQTQVSQFSGVLSMPDELQELAQENVPVRALSDLNVLWKKDKQAARDFIESTAASEITRVNVAELRSEIEAGQEVDSSSQAERNEGKGKLPGLVVGTKKQSRGIAILCRHNGEIGCILTDRKASSNQALMVSFEEGKRIEEIPLKQIELSEVIEL